MIKVTISASIAEMHEAQRLPFIMNNILRADVEVHSIYMVGKKIELKIKHKEDQANETNQTAFRPTVGK